MKTKLFEVLGAVALIVLPEVFPFIRHEPRDLPHIQEEMPLDALNQPSYTFVTSVSTSSHGFNLSKHSAVIRFLARQDKRS